MLVCNVSLSRRRAAIAADVAEAAIALDSPGTGNVVFATLVDDPASVGDHVDAFLGQIMLEAANAAATVNAGFAYAVAVAEAAAAADSSSATVPVAGTVAEMAAANSTQDATVVSGVAYATWDPATVIAVTLSGGNLVATNTGTNSSNQGARVATASGRTSGKYYFEMRVTTAGAGFGRTVGVGTTASTYGNMGYDGFAIVGAVVVFQSGHIWINGVDSGVNIGGLGTGNVGGFAVDLDNRKIWARGNSGFWNAASGASIGDPATNTGGITIPAGTMVPFVTFGGFTGAAGCVVTANFGASTFTGAVPSGFTSGWPV